MSFSQYYIGDGPIIQKFLKMVKDRCAQTPIIVGDNFENIYKPNNMNGLLKPGHEVEYRQSVGSLPMITTVEKIWWFDSPEDSEGTELNGIPWDSVDSKEVIIDLDNGHWSPGRKIKKKQE